MKSMTQTRYGLLFTILAVLVLSLFLAVGPAGATPALFGLLPADQASKACAACHDGATTKNTLNALGKKVAAAAPKTKEDMAKLLAPATGRAIQSGTRSAGRSIQSSASQASCGCQASSQGHSPR